MVETSDLKKCRLCLRDSTEVLPIFRTCLMTEEKENVLVHTFLKDIYDYIMIPNDGLPDHICIRCYVQVQFSYELLLKCNKSQKVLGEIIIKEMCEEFTDETYDSSNSEQQSDGSWEDVSEEVDLDGSSKEESMDNEYETNPRVRRTSIDYNHTIVNNQYQCCVCKVLLKKKKDFKKHFQEKHTRPFYRCTKCNQTFQMRTKFKKHWITHTMFHRCILCKRNFVNVKIFLRHVCKEAGRFQKRRAH